MEPTPPEMALKKTIKLVMVILYVKLNFTYLGSNHTAENLAGAFSIIILPTAQTALPMIMNVNDSNSRTLNAMPKITITQLMVILSNNLKRVHLV